jgi:DNA-binding transcriptional LysR family regulator
MKHTTTLKLIDLVARVGSIRKAAEELSLTPSAVHRRVQAFEAELGEVIFERLANGVRLNAAGELVVQHARMQLADLERLRSRLADLAGMRRGHIAVACSQAMTYSFLPREVAAYRVQFPDVTFDIDVRDHRAAGEALLDFSADIALVFTMERHVAFQVTIAVRQELHVIMSADHPLAGRAVLRLRDCLDYPLALPTSAFGGRQLLERAMARRSLALEPALQSNSFELLKCYVSDEPALTFQIPIGAPEGEGNAGIISRPLDSRDVDPGTLYLGQQPGRALSVAASRFQDQLAQSLAERFGRL